MNSLLKKFTFSEELTDVIENCKGRFRADQQGRAVRHGIRSRAC